MVVQSGGGSGGGGAGGLRNIEVPNSGNSALTIVVGAGGSSSPCGPYPGMTSGTPGAVSSVASCGTTYPASGGGGALGVNSPAGGGASCGVGQPGGSGSGGANQGSQCRTAGSGNAGGFDPPEGNNGGKIIHHHHLLVELVAEVELVPLDLMHQVQQVEQVEQD